MKKQSWPVYGALLVAWALVVAWQVAEHVRVGKAARAKLVDGAKDISTTVALVMRSQGRFGWIGRERLESAITTLIQPGELMSIALLNAAGGVVASAGEPIREDEARLAVANGAHWTASTVALHNLVDLGTNVTTETVVPRRTIVVPPREDGGTNRPPPSRPPEQTRSEQDEGGEPAAERPRERDEDRRRGPEGGRRGRWRPGRPPWMSEEQYQTLIEQQGVHSFVLVMSTDAMRSALRQDLWMRSLICMLGAVSAVGLGLAWRNVTKTAELEVRLVRASELNARLREMNLAAAGLAHETRNPLNIIRGLAQIISRQDDASGEVREKSRNIMDEADRVTGQLNEFIGYSRPREVRRTAVNLGSVIGEVARALGSDLEDKGVTLDVPSDLPTIEADEQLLRQALFNLIMNAIQAVDRGGEIRVLAERATPGEVWLEVRDNGPGVPPDQRTEIFRPYVTNHPDGTGLGLAVVQQIVTAHGWEIRCLANQPKGALFRVTHVRLVA